jgi:polysaccharide biosynthesis transport protein
MNEQLPLRIDIPGSQVTESRPALPVVTGPADTLRRLLAIARRRWIVFACVFLSILGAVVIYTARQAERYTTTATVVVNSRLLNISEKANSVIPDASDEDRAVNAEYQILQSPEVARRVVASLERSKPGFAARLTNGRGASNSPSTRRAAQELVQSRMRIDRPGATNILAVSFTHSDPVIAANIANAFVEQYLAFKSDARLSVARGADEALRSELDTLRSQVEAAEQNVATYRQKNDLLSADGVTLTEQEQSLYKQQESNAQTALAEERARLITARSQLARGSAGDDVGEALSSPVVNQLRNQRALVSSKLSELQVRYKSTHPDVVRVQAEVDNIDQAIRSEISRVVSNLEARVSVAQQKSGSASGIVKSSRGKLAANTAASVRLNELERQAEALRTNYAGMLQRQAAVASQAVVSDIDARILSRATVPRQPSYPNHKLNLAIGSLLALLGGALAVALLQLFDRRIVSSRCAEEQLGLPHLVNMPEIASIASRADRKMAPIDYVLEHPLSMAAESMRSLLLAIERNGSPGRTQFVGITSAHANEGKSTLAASLARVAAVAGRRTLLVDADVRRPGVANIFGVSTRVGLIEVLEGTAKPSEAFVRDERSGVWLLPVLAHPFDHAKISSGEPIDLLTRRLDGAFDLVIFDTAPSLAAAETRMILNHVGQTILAVRWRKTGVPVVKTALRQLAMTGVHPTGVVLTRVDMKAISAYAVDDVDHDYRSYANYGA